MDNWSILKSVVQFFTYNFALLGQFIVYYFFTYSIGTYLFLAPLHLVIMIINIVLQLSVFSNCSVSFASVLLKQFKYSTFPNRNCMVMWLK